MIVLVHKNGNKLSKLLVNNKDLTEAYKETPLNNILEDISLKHPKELLVWCEENFYPNINYEILDEIFHHELIMASYELGKTMQFPDAIGYIEESPFINVPRNVVYPTWKMSTDIGGINTSVIQLVKDYIDPRNSFFYFLNSIAKLSQLNGLFCYSNPELVKEIGSSKILSSQNYIPKSVLFKFVREHYNTKWVFLLFFSLLTYEKKSSLITLFQNLKFSKRSLPENIFDRMILGFEKERIIKQKIDVLIPTTNRKQALFNVLKDLSAQVHLPENVVIIEQDEINETSTLEYLKGVDWPFRIKHLFLNKKGACRARNLGLDMCDSDWIFFGDDDIRINSTFIQDALLNIQKFRIEAAQFSVLQEGESNMITNVTQSTIFGSGNSVVKNASIKDLRFSEAFEFGYGEDLDYGMELRKKGVDCIFFPEPAIKHLKLETGGFRSQFHQPWSDEKLKPNPAPSVMLYKRKHLTKEQILGYKNFYFITNLKKFSYNICKLQKAWRNSVEWSKKL